MMMGGERSGKRRILKLTQATTSVKNGFTLVGFMTSIAIIAILASSAVPSYHQIVQLIRMKSASSDLERTLRLARRQALMRGEPVRICPSVDGVFCARENSWQTGWIVFADRTGSTRREMGDPVLNVHEEVTGLQIELNTGSLLSLNRQGRITQNGSFHLCDPSNPDASLRIVMVHSGRLRFVQHPMAC